MAVRVGVDVGGTFTKAVACDAITGKVVARSVISTTHTAPLGVAEGVIVALEAVSTDVSRLGLGPILLVAHSTTQAVNALLEGDVPVVGVLGIGRRPDLKRARKRTEVGEIRLAPGRLLRTRHAFLDATDELDRRAVATAIRGLMESGAETLCVSEAFGVEDAAAERLALEIAAEIGIPACAGHELSGLYGLELRTVTAALNASILPTAMRTAEVVGHAADKHAGGAHLLVMRGDGGAAEIGTMRRRPLLTAFSGPAASVAGALHHLRIHEGIVVEVGGTSTNVSAIAGGRPVLSYVRVLEHVTCVRSLDVRVAGVAGGSMLRVSRRFGRSRIEALGPRSAHIAGLPYVSFSDPGDIVRCEPRLVSPRAGDVPDHVILEHPSGRRFAFTLTCAANALGVVAADAHARGNPDAARLGFEALGRWLGRDWRDLARGAMRAAVAGVAPLVAEASAENQLAHPTIVGVGGGAGALVPMLGDALGLPWRLAPDADVISSIGDALSLVRVEIERGLGRSGPHAVARIVEDAEDAAIAAGADPAGIQVETETIPERAAIRAVATGSIALDADTGGGGAVLDEPALSRRAEEILGSGVSMVARTRAFGVFATGSGEWRSYVVLDPRGGVSASGEAMLMVGSGAELADSLPTRLESMVRHLGPIAIAPAVRLVRGSRVVDLSALSSPRKALEAAVAECTLAEEETVVAIFSRS